MMWLKNFLLSIKVFFKKKYFSFRDYTFRCAENYEALPGGFFRICFYFLKKIKEQPSLILIICAVVSIFACLWSFFVLIKCSNVIFDYLWCQALYTHKPAGFAFIRVLRWFVVFIMVFIIGFFAFYFNKLKNKIAKNSAFFMNALKVIEYICLCIIDAWEDLKSFYLLKKKNGDYNKKIISDLWVLFCSYSIDSTDAFKKTEVYKLFMHNKFSVQTVYLFVMLLFGIILIEFLVASYWVWFFVYGWVSSVFYIGLGGISKEFFNCLILLTIVVMIVITNTININKLVNSFLVKKLLNSEDLKVFYRFIELKSSSFWLWFVCLNSLVLFTFAMYFYSCFYFVKNYENFLIITVWFCINISKIVFWGGLNYFSWSFLKYFYLADINRIDKKKNAFFIFFW